MKCKYCGAELKDDDKFCTECGAKVEVTRTCPNCGAETTGKYCVECGYDLDAAPAPAQNTVPPKMETPPVYQEPKQETTYTTSSSMSGVYMDEPKKKSPLPMLIVLAVAVVIGLGAAALMFGGSKDTEPSQDVVKQEIRNDTKDAEDKEDNVVKQEVKDTAPTNIKEDIMLTNLLKPGQSISDLKKIAEKNGKKVEDGIEIEGAINGYSVNYTVYFEEEDDEECMEVDTYFYFDTEKEYKDTLKYLQNYLESHYDRDTYDLEEGDDEFIYDSDDDFIMLFTYPEEYGIYIYRSPF